MWRLQKNSPWNCTDKKIDLKTQQERRKEKARERTREIERRGEQGEREKEREEAKRLRDRYLKKTSFQSVITYLVLYRIVSYSYSNRHFI